MVSMYQSEQLLFRMIKETKINHTKIAVLNFYRIDLSIFLFSCYPYISFARSTTWPQLPLVLYKICIVIEEMSCLQVDCCLIKYVYDYEYMLAYLYEKYI